ncbi:MAG: RNA polymerase sigma factor [Acidobacteria bacterium]|nr:RNA polymerase sigma factor [Acidobacteriota bacterium]
MRTPDAEEDGRLALALQRNDPEAFEPFVARFGPRLLSFGRRMCGHRADAEEVVQETLLKAYQSIQDLRDPFALRSWVYRVAANTCLKMRRDASAPRELEVSLEALLPEREPGGEPPQIADWSDLPLDRLLQGELEKKLEEAILGLPSEFRAVLLLRDHEGLMTREVSEVLGITEALAKVRLHRARLALRKALDGYLTTTRGAGR